MRILHLTGQGGQVNQFGRGGQGDLWVGVVGVVRESGCLGCSGSSYLTSLNYTQSKYRQIWNLYIYASNGRLGVYKRVGTLCESIKNVFLFGT